MESKQFTTDVEDLVEEEVDRQLSEVIEKYPLVYLAFSLRDTKISKKISKAVRGSRVRSFEATIGYLKDHVEIDTDVAIKTAARFRECIGNYIRDLGRGMSPEHAGQRLSKCWRGEDSEVDYTDPN
ncbi:MAG: hypothetical protein ACFFCG_06485 [Promethearchaeota archaeon]